MYQKNKLPSLGSTGSRAKWRDRETPDSYGLIKNKELKDHVDIQYKTPLGSFFNKLYPGWNNIFHAVANRSHKSYIDQEMFDKEKDDTTIAESNKKVREAAAEHIIKIKNEIYDYLTNHELNDYARHTKYVCANEGEDPVKKMAYEVVDTVLSKLNELTDKEMQFAFNAAIYNNNNWVVSNYTYDETPNSTKIQEYKNNINNIKDGLAFECKQYIEVKTCNAGGKRTKRQQSTKRRKTKKRKTKRRKTRKNKTKKR